VEKNVKWKGKKSRKVRKRIKKTPRSKFLVTASTDSDSLLLCENGKSLISIYAALFYLFRFNLLHFHLISHKSAHHRHTAVLLCITPSLFHLTLETHLFYKRFTPRSVLAPPIQNNFVGFLTNFEYSLAVFVSVLFQFINFVFDVARSSSSSYDICSAPITN